MRTTTYETKAEQVRDGCDVAIVGAGLAGLMAAAEATRLKKGVLLIEKRQEQYSALRPQLISLNPDTIKYLLKMPLPSGSSLSVKERRDDLAFLKKLKSNNMHYQIKDIQRFLKRRIDPNYCRFFYGTEVLAINAEKGYLQVSNQEKEIKFQNLVLAEGIKRDAAKLIPQIEYQSVEERPEKHHIQGYFTIESKNNKPIKLPEPPLVALYVDQVFRGYLYYEATQSHPTKVKVNIVMQVPTDQLFEKCQSDSKFGKDYLKQCVASVFNENDHMISMPKSKQGRNEKDKLKYAAFDLDFTEAKTPAFEQNGHAIILAGDSRKGPDFYQGHGGNDAMLDGVLIGRLLKKSMKLDEYNSNCQERSLEVSMGTAIPIGIVIDYRVKRFDVLPFSSTIQQPNIESKLEEKLEDRVVENDDDILGQIERGNISVFSDAFHVLIGDSYLIKKFENLITQAIQSRLKNDIASDMKDFQNYVDFLRFAPETSNAYFKNNIVKAYYFSLALKNEELTEQIQSYAKHTIEDMLTTMYRSLADKEKDLYSLNVQFRLILYFAIQFDLLDTFKDEIQAKASQLFDKMLERQQSNGFRCFNLVLEIIKEAGLLEGQMYEKCKEVLTQFRRPLDYLDSPGPKTTFLSWVSSVKAEASNAGNVVEKNSLEPQGSEVSSENKVTFHTEWNPRHFKQPSIIEPKDSGHDNTPVVKKNSGGNKDPIF